jgi:hypothetical protein
MSGYAELANVKSIQLKNNTRKFGEEECIIFGDREVTLTLFQTALSFLQTNNQNYPTPNSCSIISFPTVTSVWQKLNQNVS